MLFEKINQIYINYLTDESRLKGEADYIVFCKTTDDIKEAVSEVVRMGLGVTVQGARTGITGGAVPVRNNIGEYCCGKSDNSVGICGDGGPPATGNVVLNLSKMKQIYSIREDAAGFRIRTGPGLTLTEIENILKGDVFDSAFLDDESKHNLDKLKLNKHFFPPDPTEKSASIGGVCANCASGSRSFHFGSARNFITSLEIVLSDSSVLHFERDGGLKATDLRFSITRDGDVELKGVLPSLENPFCKNAAGIFVEKNMDLIDLFIGSEGILGIIAAVEFLVIPEPSHVSGILIFPPDRKTNLELSEYFKSEKKSLFTGRSYISAVEYFDENALRLISRYMKEGSFKTLFPFSENNRGGALYVEIFSDDHDSLINVLISISDYLQNKGVEGDSVFVSDSNEDLMRMKDFRHSVPESVNMTIDRIRKQGHEITKLGTDLAVPDFSFRELFNLYYSGLELFSSGISDTEINYAVFGHIGNNHLHVNLIPRNMDEYIDGKRMVRKWAEKAVSLGGSVSAEHGTGRLKKEYLEIMYGKEGVDKIRFIKSLFDPGFVLNRGVMI